MYNLDEIKAIRRLTKMDKKTFFFIDDVIWFLRDITRERPASIFDQHFLKVLKTAHDKYGLKVQLNLFYRTDYFYGTDEFTLSDVTDAYKAEFEANSDWLKMSFHAKQEFPDYPNVNADYDDIKELYTMMKNEVIRFAGENSWGGDSLVTHWLPLSKDACKALADCGAKMVCCTSGDTEDYVDQADCLPYGHLGRLLQNRKPETKLFFRDSRDVAIEKSICGWNHLTIKQADETKFNLGYVYDEETGLRFKEYCNTGTVNLCKTKEEVYEDISPALDKEYLCFLIHEQYFYPDYFAYMPNAAELIYYACELVANSGHRFVTGAELLA